MFTGFASAGCGTSWCIAAWSAGRSRRANSWDFRPFGGVAALDREDYRFAPESGLNESCVELGEEVNAGDTVGRIHFLERPDRQPVAVTAHAPGMLIAGRAPSMVKQGDCVGLVSRTTRIHFNRKVDRSPPRLVV